MEGKNATTELLQFYRKKKANLTWNIVLLRKYWTHKVWIVWSLGWIQLFLEKATNSICCFVIEFRSQFHLKNPLKFSKSFQFSFNWNLHRIPLSRGISATLCMLISNDLNHMFTWFSKDFHFCVANQLEIVLIYVSFKSQKKHQNCSLPARDGILFPWHSYFIYLYYQCHGKQHK